MRYICLIIFVNYFSLSGMRSYTLSEAERKENFTKGLIAIGCAVPQFNDSKTGYGDMPEVIQKCYKNMPKGFRTTEQQNRDPVTKERQIRINGLKKEEKGKEKESEDDEENEDEGSGDDYVPFEEKLNKKNKQAALLGVMANKPVQQEKGNKRKRDASTQKIVMPAIKSRKNKEGKNIFRCPFPECTTFSLWLNSLKTHYKSHFEKEKRPHLCLVENCNGAYTTIPSLYAHIKMHENKKNFKCEYEGCGRSFNRMDHLNNHISVHKDPSLFCKQTFRDQNCGAVFCRVADLRRHEKQPHDKDVQCQWCVVSFISQGAFRQHYNNTHSSRKFLRDNNDDVQKRKRESEKEQ